MRRGRRGEERPRFECEKHLVDEFAAWARAGGWSVYFEVEAWDALVVSPNDLRVGVEAKLTATCEVLAQAHERLQHGVLPDRGLVLVPSASPPFCYLARELGVGVLEAERLLRPMSFGGRGGPLANLPAPPRSPWPTASRIEVPQFVDPNGAGGLPSPRAVTPWRIAAVRFCARLRAQGWTTRPEIEAAGLSPTFWTGGRLLVRDGKSGRITRYRLDRPDLLPDVGWEWLAEQIAREDAAASALRPGAVSG